MLMEIQASVISGMLKLTKHLQSDIRVCYANGWLAKITGSDNLYCKWWQKKQLDSTANSVIISFHPDYYHSIYLSYNKRN